jgi:capsular exopolysaccharide synthesis family protein
MSEFFKALEQAERDRLRQAQAEAATAPPVARTAPRERTAVSEPAPPRPPATEPAEVKAAVAEPAAAKPAAPKPAAPKPAAPKPDVPRPSVAKAAPPSSIQAPSPASVFRPALRTPERSRVTGRLNGRQSLLIAQSDPSSLEADAYRTVRANIELMSDDGAYRHIAITSAAGGDGKSTTAANLAVVAAQAGRRVCLVDADLRRPILHEVFGLSNVEGLTSALQHGRPLHEVARPADIENLSIVVAGRGAEEAFNDLLTPQRLERILRASEAAFDLVIFDSPPVVVADALGVAAACDGVILVVRAGSIPFAVLRRAIGQLRQVKGRVLGVLLNQADLRTGDAGSYQYYHAHHTTRSKS